ncbi:serine protease 33-like [Hyla sarda]|uniref:serine protease 33-like n=1 Tax=Hyla sarda TaxID=327740 RepID=UPI0024C34016|nr:serine protease 33-like [Hyla sarda]
MKSGRLTLHLLMSVLVIGLVKRTATACGRPTFSQRVVGGKNSVSGKWPWQISIIYERSHLCGGSLISTSWVVTAAHCMSSERRRRRRGSSVDHRRSTHRRHRRLTNGELYVMLGVLNLTGTSTSGVIVPVKTVIIHPIYNGDGTSGDLALLELESPVTFNNYIWPICLPSPNQVFPDGMMCWLTGWGDIAEGVKLSAPYILQEVDLPLINSSACDQMFRDIYNIDSSIVIVQEDMICAGYCEGKKDACQGDSGGPLACQIGSSWFLAGIVSWGDGCARPGEPGVYTKVSSFSAWIQENINLPANSGRKINATTIDVNTFSTKTPQTTAQSFSLSKNIHGISNLAGPRSNMATAHMVLLMILFRTLDIL